MCCFRLSLSKNIQNHIPPKKIQKHPSLNVLCKLMDVVTALCSDHMPDVSMCQSPRMCTSTHTAGSYNSRVLLANLCKYEEILSKSDTKHDLQVDSSNINT